MDYQSNKQNKSLSTPEKVHDTLSSIAGSILIPLLQQSQHKFMFRDFQLKAACNNLVSVLKFVLSNSTSVLSQFEFRIKTKPSLFPRDAIF